MLSDKEVETIAQQSGAVPSGRRGYRFSWPSLMLFVRNILELIKHKENEK